MGEGCIYLGFGMADNFFNFSDLFFFFFCLFVLSLKKKKIAVFHSVVFHIPCCIYTIPRKQTDPTPSSCDWFEVLPFSQLDFSVCVTK